MFSGRSKQSNVMPNLMIKLFLLKSCVQFKMRIFFSAWIFFVWRNRLPRKETEAQVGTSGRQELLYRRTINNLAVSVGALEVLEKKFTRLSHLRQARRVSPSPLILLQSLPGDWTSVFMFIKLPTSYLPSPQPKTNAVYFH